MADRRSPAGVFADIVSRITALERRISPLPARLGPRGREVTDLDEALEFGSYWARASAANNPVGNIALVEVFPYGPEDPGFNRIMQEARFPSTGASNQTKTWRRVLDVNSGTWTPWTDLSTYPVSEAQLPARIQASPTPLGNNVNLNTIIESGWYVQNQNAGASFALNYPIEQAGYLEVIRSGAMSGNSVGVLQRYTRYVTSGHTSADVWQRQWYGSWGAWIQLNAYSSLSGAPTSLPTAWSDVSGKPSTFPPSGHTHPSSQITDFATAVPAAVPAASTTVAGKVELATKAEIWLGTDPARTVSIEGLLQAFAEYSPRMGRAGFARATSDWNTATETGFYFSGSAANSPAAGTFFGLVYSLGSIDAAHSSGDFLGFVQVVRAWDPSTNTFGLEYRRSQGFAGTWSAWTAESATPTARGTVELATSAEVAAGTDNERAVTPASLLGRTSTTSRRGLVELATNAESIAGTDNERAVTPAGLQAALDAAGAGDTVQWSAIEGKPSTFPSTWATVSGKPSTFPPSSHSHNWSELNDPLVHNLGTIEGLAAPDSFPLGVSFGQAGSDFPESIGTVISVRHSSYRHFQHFYDRGNPTQVWIRASNGATWQPWNKLLSEGHPHSHAYADITGKPSTFPPSSHTHDDRYYTETEVNAKLAGKSDTGHTHAWSAITGKPSTFTPSSHNHDDRYYTESQVNAKLDDQSIPFVSFKKGVFTEHVWNRNITGTRRAAWITNANTYPTELGHTASSERYKQDITAFDVTDEQVLAIAPVLYRYKEQVELHGDDAPVDFGMIAEVLEAAGMGWAVFYEPDEDGEPRVEGIHYERAWLALLPAVQRLITRVASIEAHLGLEATS